MCFSNINPEDRDWVFSTKTVKAVTQLHVCLGSEKLYIIRKMQVHYVSVVLVFHCISFPLAKVEGGLHLCTRRSLLGLTSLIHSLFTHLQQFLVYVCHLSLSITCLCWCQGATLLFSLSFSTCPIFPHLKINHYWTRILFINQESWSDAFTFHHWVLSRREVHCMDYSALW